MSSRLRARVPAAGATAALALVLAGCGGGGGTAQADPAAVVQAASLKTTAAKTSKVSLTTTASVAGQAIKATGDGAFDYAARRGSFTLDLTAAGQSLMLTELLDGTSVYVKLPAQVAGQDTSALTGGKPWLKVDASKLGAGSSLGAGDPSQGLSLLKNLSGPVTAVGPEQVRGTPTTHYATTVDVAKQLADSMVDPKVKELLRQSFASAAQVPVDIWVDSAGRARRMVEALTLAASAATGGQGAKTTVTTEFYDFGTAVQVQVPPADQVGDGSKLLGGLTGGS